MRVVLRILTLLFSIQAFALVPEQQEADVVPEDSAINPEAVLDSNFRFFEPEDMRKSIKWRGFIVGLEGAGLNDWARVREMLFTLREFLPDNVMLMEQSARLHILSEEWGSAETIWYELFARQPGRTDILPELSWVLLHQDKDEEASRIVDVVLNREPDHLESRLIRAVLLIRSGKSRMRHLEQFTIRECAHLCYLLSSRPRTWTRYVKEDGYRDLVSFVFAGGAWAAAKPLDGSIQDVAERAGRNAGSLVQLEKAMALRQNSRARKALDASVMGGMHGPLMHAYEAYVKFREGETIAARSDFEFLVASNLDRDLIRHLQAAMLVELGDGRAAQEALAPLLEGNPTPDQQFLALLCHCLLDEMEEAWTIYRNLATVSRKDLLRLIRQEEPILAGMRQDPGFLDVFRPKEEAEEAK